MSIGTSSKGAGSFPGPRFYTIDFLDPVLTGGETLGTYNPDCSSLRENIVAQIDVFELVRARGVVVVVLPYGRIALLVLFGELR